MHKDLSDDWRAIVDAKVRAVVIRLHLNGQSLAIAREAAIKVFDDEASSHDA